MHIKRIVIQGFKTYKNTTVIDDISPGHNVVVGRNGSGKSNFFAAIRFVLSDQYTRMTKEERQGLIHDGSGSVLSAYVEIVFDNTDGRFAIAKDEVVIRRTIGLKKDDYSLDHKSSTRIDIMQLLENAGFSKSNPYYIVPQGRITALTNAKDSERLNLLKEVAGAKVFETKLKESQKEMIKTKSQREKIDEMLKFIQERLADLDSEKDELKNFQEFEKDKKIIEFILYDRELNDVTTAIEAIDGEYQTDVDSSKRFVGELEKREDTIKELEDSIKAVEHEIKLLSIDENEKSDLLRDVAKELYEKSAELAELKEFFKDQTKSAAKKEQLLTKIQAKVDKNEKELASKEPIIQELKTQEAESNGELSTLKTKQSILYAKQGRYSKFSNKKERDQWLDKEIGHIQQVTQTQTSSVKVTETEIREIETKLKEIEEQADDLQDTINGPSAQAEIQELEQQVADLKRQNITENDERKTLWREEARGASILKSLDEEVRFAQREVNQTMDRQQSLGLESVKRIATRLNLSGVHGPLGELLTVNSKYRAAVEVVAGNSLFHVVVDNDRTASILMEELVREQSGRVTFMPLNRLQPKDTIYPDSQDCVPLIKKIGFDSSIEKAVKQVFGKSIVTINLERGYELSRQYKLSAITLDGDKADKKGVLTGGYQDFRNSRLETMKVKQSKVKELRAQEAELENVRRLIQEKDSLILSINDQISHASAEFENLISSKQPLKSKLSSMLNEKFALRDELKYKQERIVKLRSSIAASSTKLSELEAERGSAFIEGLSSEEKQELARLGTDISIVQKKLIVIQDKISQEENECESIKIELNEVLKPRLNELMKSKTSNSGDSIKFADQSHVEELSEHVESISEKKQVLEQEIQDFQTKLSQKKKESKKLSEKLEDSNDQQRKIIKKLEKYQHDSEKNLSRRALLTQRRDDFQRKIRELGALPEEAFSDKVLSSKTSDELLRKLTKITKSLDKFSHVNRKALEQYLNFTKQRDGLVERRKELDNSEESIEELINVLSSRKEDAIQKTFTQVSKSFSEVFEKLVPKGIGKLVIEHESEEDEEDDNEDEDHPMTQSEESNINSYKGVSIQVSFNSKHDEQQKIEQLSGGQKSLCAIALILAIQKSDPAPFYLFDEIDANLDTQYRTAVANLIHELSGNAQFICTTFRPEMLQVANSFFGVMFNNKISTVSEINKEEALGFIEGQQGGNNGK
ncbi:hypothetical protein WICPIJ_009249 [Wickerhamomyces pijperi]|uniref:Structural maintenance of chromosomes protein n=1 Tax=Wickerhamomyces pijperi TaxID=599730 RepID=A0A9P8TED9_WICPI|nr:hypothetical protein WICPIJ_009249 [Wickerhamomyces pijperi]